MRIFTNRFLFMFYRPVLPIRPSPRSVSSSSIIVKLYSEDTGRDYMFKSGDKISQIVILPIPKVELEVVAELDETERGDGRMGSTGR